MNHARPMMSLLRKSLLSFVVPLASALLFALAAHTNANAQQKTSGATQEPPAALTIRKNLAARLPQIPAISEVRALPVTGLYEVRIGDHDLFYTDAQGRHLIQGQIIDLQTQRNLTSERVDELTAVNFKDLPFGDAFVIRRGKGERQLAIFSDPECTFCRELERELVKLDNVTVHVFLYPVLGPQSTEKAQTIWCAAPAQRAQVWLDWMLKSVPPQAAGNCPAQTLATLKRNVEFGRKYRIDGTPALFFADDKRASGALSARQIERQFAAAASSTPRPN